MYRMNTLIMNNPHTLNANQLVEVYMGFLYSSDFSQSTIDDYVKHLVKLQAEFGVIVDIDYIDEILELIVCDNRYNKHGTTYRCLRALRVMLSGEGTIKSRKKASRGISMDEAKRLAGKYAHMVEFLCMYHPKMFYKPSSALGYVKSYVKGRPLDGDKNRNYQRAYKALHTRFQHAVN